MALTTTTNSSAIAASDSQIVVASATGFAANYYVKVGSETMKVLGTYSSGTTIPVLRGQNGSYPIAHEVTSNVTVGTGSDFGRPPVAQTVNYPLAGRTRLVKSYGVAGAITHPTPGGDMLAIINGTAALAMTLTSPTKDMDGCIVIVCGNGKAAHTITYTTTGFGDVGATADVVTFGANQAQAFQFIAANGIWNLLGPLATATANVSGPSIA